MIVPWATATRFCDGTAAAIDANHFNTVKPDRAGHDSLVLLVNALNETVLGKDLIGQLEIPDFKPEGDHRVFTIADPEADSVARMKNVGRRELQYSFERSDPKLVIDPERAAIEPRAERSVALFLKFGADKPEYNVVLHTDFGPLADARVEQTKVLVRVRDLTAARAGQLQLAAGVVEDMSNFLSKPEQNRLQRLPANDPEAPIEIATVAHNSVAERAELPQTASWLLTADLFNAANWPTLSVQALRKAEESSATVANSVSVQRLAAVAAANSGERRIFRAADTSPQPTVELSSVHPFANPAVARASSKLASQLQAIPAVAAQGLTLEGDLKRLQGDTAGARDLYRRVEQLQRSPMVTQLLSSVTANATPPQRDRSDPLTLVARRDLKLPQLANTSVAKELQMQNIGRTRLQLSAALVLPRTDKSALRVVADKCAGSTLEPKQTCSLWVECVGDPSATRNVAVVVTSPATAGKEMDWEAVCGQLDLIYSQGRPEDAELARNPNLDRLEVRNIGKAKLAIGAVQVSNPRSFSVASDQCSQTTLAPQESCSIVIDCLEMDREAHISIPNSGDAGPLKIQWQRVCGRPKAPIIVVG
jgi:hypothetical protein